MHNAQPSSGYHYTSTGMPNPFPTASSGSANLTSPRHAVVKTMNETFQYQPLPHGQDAFRLVRLHPGCQGNPIKCDLFSTRISEWSGKYIAGSYVWGSKSDRKKIRVNGKQLHITRNLFEFLCACRLHRQDQPLFIWIDSICIDQWSIHERNHQVQIMASIYSSASCVYSWLGAANDDSDWLFDAACGEEYIAGLRAVHEHADYQPPGDVSLERYRLALWRRVFGGAETLWRTLTSFIDLITREYWNRIWIVQEVVLAPEILLLCGSKSMAWRILWELCRTAILFIRVASDPEVGSFPLLETSYFNIVHLRSETKSLGVRSRFESRYTFEKLYARLGGNDCSVRQDGVFALMGLLPETGNAAKQGLIDYSVPSSSWLLTY